MAVNYKNSVPSVTTGHVTFPASSNKTGTIDIAAGETSVIGTNTLFSSELLVNGWICDIAHDEIRKITQIKNDTLLAIDHPFSNAQVAATLVYIEPSNSVDLMVVFAGDGGTIDGVPVPANVGISANKSGRDMSGEKDFVDPVIVNATGTSAFLFQLK